MNQYINPPCSSSSTTSCIESAMVSSSVENRLAAPFTEGVSSSAEWEMAIDEIASTVSLAPNHGVVPGPSLAVQQGEEYVRNFLDDLSGDQSAASHLVLGAEADNNDSFVRIGAVSL